MAAESADNKPDLGSTAWLSNKQKAAMVIISLGADKASEIYKYLQERDIEDLTYEVARLGQSTNSQVEGALDEFYKLCLTHKMMTDGGLDYARSVLEKAFGETTARNLLEKVSKTLQSRPFNFLSKGDPKALIGLMQNERPQVIALILSYLDSELAASVMMNLPDDKRLETISVLAKMDRVSPEAISVVEAETKRKFDTIVTSEDNMNIGGIDFAADVMNHIDRSVEKRIFDDMEKVDPDLASEIKDRMFVFEDILGMDDRSVQRFIRECNTKDIVYALKTATDDMKQIFFNNMSKRMAETVTSDMQTTTNVRLKDVEEAQQRIVNLIRKLEDQGELIISKGGSDDDALV
ncbi:MAG: flagellar motor switch protein FliG [Eubacterium sp.]|nr:flagellar motor switch protein FliG [Eubacterium sp.]